ncbi:UNVERIFIED_CONTAM: hypothetical protein Scaly_2654100 [Sesamum calycinum]|uniref:Uncharacterized protein n=1 Tax=Sesamum calycinum TaxID=2727403 RepID=A0AAW2J972_9LAMI
MTLEEFFPQIFFEQKDKTVSALPRTDRRQSLVCCCTTLSFTDEDLLLGSKSHNRPLFILGFIQEQKINCILIGGSTVNTMPKSTMKKLGRTLENLSRGCLMIQDVRTSYKLLLERPWLHENEFVPSTLHQGFKYIKNREIVKVDADMKPFTKAESYFADTKLYLDLDKNNNEMLSKTIKNEAPASGKHEVKKPPYSPVFRYVVRSNGKEKQNQRKDHNPPLFKGRKQLKEARVKDLQKIKTKLVTPITNLHPLISRGPIKVKQHVSRKPHDPSDSSNEEEVEIIFNSNHISIDEGSNLDISEDEIQNAPPPLEYGVKMTIYELKELNLDTIEEPRPIFISALLSPEEDK